MGSFRDIVMIIWPIAATITPILLAIGLLWLRTKFADIQTFNATAAEVALLKTKVEVLELQCRELNSDIDSEPTRVQVIDKIGNAIERLSRLEGSFEAIERHMRSQSAWIQALALPEGRR